LYFSWYPSYLQRARAVSPELASQLTSLVLAGSALGCLLGGLRSDQLVRRTGNRRLSRRLTGFGGFAVAGVAMLVSVRCDSPIAAAYFTALAVFSAAIHLTTWWAATAEISGEHLGTIFGLMNSTGALGGVASQVFLGAFVDWLGHRGYE